MNLNKDSFIFEISNFSDNTNEPEITDFRSILSADSFVTIEDWEYMPNPVTFQKGIDASKVFGLFVETDTGSVNMKIGYEGLRSGSIWQNPQLW